MKHFKFTPLLKTLIWGTESWQISGVAGNETLAEDGSSLNTLVKEMKGQLVGEANYQRFGDEFPLLIKFIDARQDLSIQVHPSDEIAHRQGKPRGKTEMWYVMESAADAKLYNGLKMKITPDEYKQMVAEDTICDALAQYAVKDGDCFFIPAGRIHAIGAGCYLAEIQQTSDVTYRIYDYKRKDKDGNYRQLHTQEASECIDYCVKDDYRQQYEPKKNESQLLVECPYFNTAVYDLDEPMEIDYSELDSFVILIGLKGEGALNIDGDEVSFKAGESILIPATAQSVAVSGSIKFLETYVLS
ncbi:MAG: class I mannose-6-phosphate isomerase [Prevotella sp.]|jgi:mannose-6-phosphate isomerase|nr:class I mannose-6-phosphate isomerase [Prevotella sp.]